MRPAVLLLIPLTSWARYKERRTMQYVYRKSPASIKFKKQN